MSRRPRLDPATPRLLGFGSVMTGVSIASAAIGHPGVALGAGVLAAAAVLSTLAHLVHLENSR